MSSTPDPIDPDADFLLDPVAETPAGSAEGPETDAAPAPEALDADALETQAAGAVETDAVEQQEEPAAPADPDPRLLEAKDLALAALREITPASTIGDAAEYRVEADGVVSLRFTNRLAGYPGWFWTVSLARVEDAEPTVLEVELLPGEGALLAPEWVPWAVRLADYHAAQAAAQAEAAADDEPADEDELEDVDDLDAADFDDDGSPILHAGDVDGVDIDELADVPDDDDSDADDSHEDDSDDDSEYDDSEYDDSEYDDDSDDDSEFDDDEFDDDGDRGVER